MGCGNNFGTWLGIFLFSIFVDNHDSLVNEYLADLKKTWKDD